MGNGHGMKTPTRAPDRTDDRIHRRIIAWGSALGFAGMLASLALIERGDSGRLTIRWHWAAIPLSAAGIGIGLCFWRLIFGTGAAGSAPNSGRVKAATALLFVLGVGCFLYPMRFVEPDRRMDAIIGVSTAIAVLTGFGVLIWKTIRWVNENEPRDGEAD